MATITVEGGQLKMVVGTEIYTVPLDDVIVESKGADSIVFKQCTAPILELERSVITAPTSTSVENLIDQIGVLINVNDSGITNLTFKERFAKDLKIISVVKQWEFELGSVAREIEKKALNAFSSERIKTLKLLKSHGNTELFEKDVLSDLTTLIESY